MHFRLPLFLATGLLAAGVASADVINQYSLSVTLTGSEGSNNTFLNQTFTGTFSVDEQTGDVTNFSTNLLNANPPFTASNLGNVAVFDATGKVVALTFGFSIVAADGTHGGGFTTGFESSQLAELNLNANNYFAFLTTRGVVEGGGTPVFTLLPSTAAPEPTSLYLAGGGLLAAAGALGRRKRR